MGNPPTLWCDLIFLEFLQLSKGSISNYIPYLVQSIKHGLQDIGSNSVKKLHNDMRQGNIRFEIRTLAGIRDGDIHSLYSYEK